MLLKSQCWFITCMYIWFFFKNFLWIFLNIFFSILSVAWKKKKKTHQPSPASQTRCPLLSPDEPGAVSPLPGASDGGCLLSAQPAQPGCRRRPPLMEITHICASGSVSKISWTAKGMMPWRRYLPCSHRSTSMLGGILRALLAMCFNNVVFPLL